MTTTTVTEMPLRVAPERTGHDRGIDPDLAALVNAARAGDDVAWRRLVTRYERRLRDVVRSYRLSPADADDVLQTTWLRLFNNIGRIRDPDAVGAWLATTARRECLRLLQGPTREQLTDDADLGEACEQDSPEVELLAAERRAVLNRALATLPERHRRLMAMLASEEAPDYRHISQTLAMPIGSIGPIRARSIARLLRHPELHGIRPGAG